MNNSLNNDFESISMLDTHIDDFFEPKFQQNTQLPVPCACFVEDEHSDVEDK